MTYILPNVLFKHALVKSICEIFRYWGGDAYGFSCNRMDEFQLEGMQRLAFDDAVIRIVEKIPWKRVSDVLHMHPDLMGTAGFQVKFD